MAYGTINADVIQSSVSGVSLGAGNATVFKNRIINGDMRIDQRNAGASYTVTAGITYGTCDRWVTAAYQSSKFSIQQNAGAVTPPAGFINYLGATSLSAYSVPSTEAFWINQKIEGLNVSDLGFGTANAKTVTISFWVRSSLTGTFGGGLTNYDASRCYPFSFSIPTANTWTQISITIAGDTTGTWLTTNGIGLSLNFSLGAGSTFTGTGGAWGTSGPISATGTVSVVGTSGATFYITGVQLEVGSSATGFEYNDYGNQLIQCQRYFEMSYPQGTAVGTATQNNAVFAYINGVSTITGSAFCVKYSQVKRTSPTVTTYSTANTNTSGVMTSASNGANYSTTVSANSDSSFGAYWTQVANSLNATMQWTASAEL